MLYDLATIHDEYDRFRDQEVTVRCQIRSNAMAGEREGQKTLYEIDDPRGNFAIPTFLSFWTDDPEIPGIGRTRQYVLDALETNENGEPLLPRGESVLVRGTPRINQDDDGELLFLNVTSVLVRAPDHQIGKGEMAVNDQCPRRYYLNYVKKVYTAKFPVDGNRFRGDVVHRVAERALDEHYDRFVNHEWTSDSAEAYVNEVLEDEFGIRMAKLSISGIGLDDRDDAIEIATRLFTDEEFCDRLASADSHATERALGDGYGYRGDVDLVLDGIPYDFKTSRSANVSQHGKQLQLYLFALLLERVDVGDDLGERLDDVPEGYIVYPNIAGADGVQFERVELIHQDVRELLTLRNAVADARGTFGPPSTYNRDCENCRLRTEEKLVTPRDQDRSTSDTLPSACKFHCQTERRWPCYETAPDGGVVSDCSLFDECEQRLEYRDPDRVDHYNSLRAALEVEEERRETASDLLAQLDSELLTRSGRLLQGLVWAGGGMDHAVFASDEQIVPAFAPGDTVILEPEADGAIGKSVTFLGVDDGEYRVQLNVPEHSEFLQADRTYRIRRTFEPETVSRKFLSYVDYAQRRGHNRRFDHDEQHEIDSGSLSLDEAGEVATYLGNDEVFLDVPVRPDRTAVIEDALEALVGPAVEYPRVDGDGSVPDDGQRALILGSTPGLVELAERALPDGPHYRMDGGGVGEEAIHTSDSYHDTQDRWNESRSLCSSVQYALETEHFHSLVEGAFGDRNHSARFFDVLVLLGAEQVTEPEYLFLSDLADRVVAIGDTRGLGPSMVSAEATERSLDRSYFAWAHERYASLPVDDAVSLQVPGEANEFVQDLYPDDEWQDSGTGFSFLDIEGDVAIDAGEIEVRSSVRARQGVPFELVFSASNTSASPFAVQSAFESMDYLDATLLREGEVALVDDLPLFLERKEQLDSTGATHHRVVIRSDASRTPEFERAFLYNRPEARIVSEVADDFGADIVVTPFETHANELRARLDEADEDVPVALPEHLDERVERAIVSFGISNEHGVLQPTLTEPEMLYRLLTCGDDMLLVGHGDSLRSKRDLATLIDDRAADYES